MAESKRNKDVFEMTQEGYEELLEERKRLQKSKLENAARIEEARSFGDLSENAEYQSAKDEQAKIDARILEVEYQKSHAKIIDTSNMDNSHVVLGKTVTVRDLASNMEYTYTLDSKPNPEQGVISTSSPVGSALNNKKVNDEVAVKVPGGFRKLKIINIES